MEKRIKEQILQLEKSILTLQQQLVLGEVPEETVEERISRYQERIAELKRGLN